MFAAHIVLVIAMTLGADQSANRSKLLGQQLQHIVDAEQARQTAVTVDNHNATDGTAASWSKRSSGTNRPSMSNSSVR